MRIMIYVGARQRGETAVREGQSYSALFRPYISGFHEGFGDGFQIEGLSAGDGCCDAIGRQ